MTVKHINKTQKFFGITCVFILIFSVLFATAYVWNSIVARADENIEFEKTSQELQESVRQTSEEIAQNSSFELDDVASIDEDLQESLDSSREEALESVLCEIGQSQLLALSSIGETGYDFDENTGLLTFNTKNGIYNWIVATDKDPSLYSKVQGIVFKSEVNKIPEYSFQEGALYSSLTSIVFEGDIIIADRNFINVDSLNTLTFNGVSIIGERGDDSGIFVDCANIQNITFNEPTYIFGYAFKLIPENGLINNSLTSLTIPDNSCLLNNGFENYDALTSLTVGDNVQIAGTCFKDCDVLLDINFTGTVFISGCAFQDGKFESINFPAFVSVAGGAFKYANSLDSINFCQESVLADGAFAMCEVIRSITFGKATKIYSCAFCVKWNDEETEPNTTLTSLDFPAGSDLGATKTDRTAGGLFMYYNSLNTVTFQGDINVNSADFGHCENLSIVDFKGKCDLFNCAFMGSKKISTINFGGAAGLHGGCFSAMSTAFTSPESSPNNTELKSLRFPEGSFIKEEKDSFYNTLDSNNNNFSCFTKLESVIFEGDINIGRRDFAGCPNLKSVKIYGKSILSQSCFFASTNIEEFYFGKATYMTNVSAFGDTGEWTGYPNNKLKELRFPAGSSLVTEQGTICSNWDSVPGGGLICNMRALEKVVFEGDIVLNNATFEYCPAIKELEFRGETWWTDGPEKQTFWKFPNLEKLTFSKAVHLKYNSFSNNRYAYDAWDEPEASNTNTKLKEIIFPEGSEVNDSNVIDQDGNAFMKDFKGLETVIFKGDIELSGACFQDLPELKTLIFEGKSELSGNAFMHCPKIETLEFWDSIKLYGAALKTYAPANYVDSQHHDWIKYKNTVLKSLVIPAGSDFGGRSGENITGAFFENYTALENVVFKGDITLSGADFTYCDNLKSVIFEGKATVHGGAFNYQLGTTTLETLIFNDKAVINNFSSGGAFMNLINLKNLIFKNEAELGGPSFYGCSSIENLVFDKKVTISGTSFSSGLTYAKLPSITLPDGSAINGQNCFYMYLGNVIFEGNSNVFCGYCSLFDPLWLTSMKVTYASETPPNFVENLFSKCDPSDLTINVPCTSEAIYKEEIAKNNSNYVSCVKGIHIGEFWATPTQHLQKCRYCGYEIPGSQEDHEVVKIESDESQHWNVCFCGQIVGEKENHYNASSEWQCRDGKHFQVCDDCGREFNFGEHNTDGLWEVDDDAHWHVCDDCDASFDIGSHFHDGSIYSDEEDHWNVCKICNHKLNVDAHTYSDVLKFDDDEHWHVCSQCNAEADDKEAHEYSEDYDFDSTKHWNSCTSCDHHINEAVHVDDGQVHLDDTYHWKVCSVCGCEYDKVEHASTGQWYSDGIIHWKVCDDCGTWINYHSHDGDASDDEWCTDASKHWHECDICGEFTNSNKVYDVFEHNSEEPLHCDASYHWFECDVCNEPFNKEVHKHTGEWLRDELDHWRLCPDCECEIDRDAHTASEEWNFDEDSHWHWCVVCNEPLNTEEHVADQSGYRYDEKTHWYVCSDCGQLFGKAQHRAGEHGYYCDENSHWFVCADCGQTSGKVPHRADENGYYYDENSHWYVCADCGTKFAQSQHEFNDDECQICHYKIGSQIIASTIDLNGYVIITLSVLILLSFSYLVLSRTKIKN